jgi:hypothetical protein
MNEHRRTWEAYNGRIPVDEKGRSYEIHHIDGNHNNNEIENLACVSIEEHYKIHLNQGDLVEAALVAKRMRKVAEAKSLLKQAVDQKLLTLQDANKVYDIQKLAAEKNKNTSFYNNGVRNFRLKPDDPLVASLTKGMLKKHYNASNTSWYTDGIRCYRLLPNDPSIKALGLVQGKLKRSRAYEAMTKEEKINYLESQVSKLQHLLRKVAK